MEFLHINAGSLFAIGIGLAGVFFGFKFFRAFLALFGFIAGYALGGWILSLFEVTNSTVLLIAGVVVGLVVAVIAYALYKWAVFFFGGLLGLAVGVIVLSFLDVNQLMSTIILVLAVLIGGLLSTLLADIIIVLSTSIVGATQVVYGVALLFPSLSLGQPQMSGGTDNVVSLGVIAVLGAAGIIFQLKRR